MKIFFNDFFKYPNNASHYASKQAFSYYTLNSYVCFKAKFYFKNGNEPANKSILAILVLPWMAAFINAVNPMLFALISVTRECL